AVEENGNELFFGGASKPFLHQADTYFVPLTSVACATRALCVAVDEVGNEITYTSHGTALSWSRPGHIDLYRLTAVSCTRAGYCLAVDDNGGTVVFNHGDWYPATRTVPLGAITAVSCVSRATCAATDATRAALGTAKI